MSTVVVVSADRRRGSWGRRPRVRSSARAERDAYAALVEAGRSDDQAMVQRARRTWSEARRLSVVRCRRPRRLPR